MIIPGKKLNGTFIRRYKRFLADIKLDSGEMITAHCPNSGSMKTCLLPNQPVIVTHHPDPKRKLKYTWEMIYNGSTWIGINTIFANKIVSEAIQKGLIPELFYYNQVLHEKKYGKNSRIDLLLKNNNSICYVEVKNVTLVENNLARFPDAVTTRGQKHLKELMNEIQNGNRAVIFFLIQREDADSFAPADDIDPTYGKLLRDAFHAGVEIMAYQCKLSPEEISIWRKLPVML